LPTRQRALRVGADQPEVKLLAQSAQAFVGRWNKLSIERNRAVHVEHQVLKAQHAARRNIDLKHRSLFPIHPFYFVPNNISPIGLPDTTQHSNLVPRINSLT
jgi:hypothetical protein